MDSHPDENLETVYVLDDAMKANILRNALIEAGIPCEISGDHQAGLTGLSIMKIELLGHTLIC